jgi:phage tail-like protein
MKHEQIARLLPEVFRSTLAPHTPLAALLEVMDALHAPAEGVLADIDAVFDPYRAPDALVPVLASWVDLDRFFSPQHSIGAAVQGEPISSGTGRLRELVVAASELSQWRGTAHGLVRILELAVGMAGFEIDEQVPADDGTPRPFYIVVRAPGEARRHQALIERIVEQEKPAYVTYQLIFRQ